MWLDIPIDVLRVIKEHGPRLGWSAIIRPTYVTLVPAVAHEPEEQVLVFEVMIAAHMHDFEGLDHGSAEMNCLVAIRRMSFLNEPCRHVCSNEALLVGDEVVGAISDLELRLGLLYDLVDLLTCPLRCRLISRFNHLYFSFFILI